MKLKVKKKANSKIKNSYKVIAEFMDGDADGFNTDELIVPISELEDENNMAEFESLLLTIERCNHAWPHGKGGYDGYEDVEGYEKHIGWDATSPYSMEHVSGGYCDDCISSFDGWSLLYYDELGNEFPVSVTFNKDEKKSFEEAAKVDWR